MLCDHCKERDGVVTLTTVEGDSVRQLTLCERCAAERGVETPSLQPKNPLGEFLQAVQQHGGLAGGALPAGSGLGAEAEGCSFCHTTLRDFRESGRLGCAHCYDTFERSLRDLLRRVHGHSVHVGRRYEPPAAEVLLQAVTLVELRTRLERAVEGEEFELAAALRDQIRGLQ